MSTVFSGLSPLVIDEVSDEGTWIRIQASTPGGPRNCPTCGTATSQVHAYEHRVVADIPVDARRVAIVVVVRRLKCVFVNCVRQTFREQLPGVLERYQRRTPRLTGQIGAVARELAGRASAFRTGHRHLPAHRRADPARPATARGTGAAGPRGRRLRAGQTYQEPFGECL